MASVSALRKPKVSIGMLIDTMHGVREERRALAKHDKSLSEQYGALEQQLIAALDAEDIDKSAGHKASASISENSTFSFDGDTGFDTFMAYVAKTKYFHLVQRRVSTESVRELFTSKGKVPGLVPYTKRTINLHSN